MQRTILLVRIEKRLSFDGIDTMDHLVNQEEVDLTRLSIKEIFKKLKTVIKTAFEDKFSFEEKN